MAVAERYIPKLIDNGKGGFRPETVEEREKRRTKEYEKEEKIRIKEIMKEGFTKKQATYLRKLEHDIYRAAHTFVPPPRY